MGCGQLGRLHLLLIVVGVSVVELGDVGHQVVPLQQLCPAQLTPEDVVGEVSAAVAAAHVQADDAGVQDQLAAHQALVVDPVGRHDVLLHRLLAVEPLAALAKPQAVIAAAAAAATALHVLLLHTHSVAVSPAPLGGAGSRELPGARARIIQGSFERRFLPPFGLLQGHAEVGGDLALLVEAAELHDGLVHGVDAVDAVPVLLGVPTDLTVIHKQPVAFQAAPPHAEYAGNLADIFRRHSNGASPSAPRPEMCCQFYVGTQHLLTSCAFNLERNFLT